MVSAMTTTHPLPGLDETVTDLVEKPRAAGTGAKPAADAPPRLRRPDRRQVLLEPVCWEERLAADHPVRAVWAVVERLDLSRLSDPIAARGESPGRAATDPRLLVALWLYATIENVGSARQLARLCEMHDAYRWLCGGVTLNHHTLSDFRVAHEAALDDLLTQVIAALVMQDVVTVARLSQDGLRTRASAGSASFRREPSLRRLLDAARAHVEAVKQQADDGPAASARQQAARARAARERVERIEAALAVLPELQAAKTASDSGKPSKDRPVRVSTTDPEARRMKVGDGAIHPAYNVQFAVDTASRAVVGVDVVNTGSDQRQSEPLRQQVERRTGRRVREHLFDGGFVKKDLIDRAESGGVAIYAPLPTSKAGQPCVVGRGDPPGVAAWRQRMRTPQGQAIYRERAATAETVNAETKTYRGLGRLLVRGLRKARCIALWSALAYNVVHFARHLSG
jgi:transposase